MLNASDFINRLVRLAGELGATVDLHAFDLHYGGLYRSETREIFLNVPNAEAALMTLAHEIGHHVGYILAGHERNAARPSLHRERQAYVYGWRVLRLVGADKFITREQWIRKCVEGHRRFLDDQRAAQGMPRKRFRGFGEGETAGGTETH
jgi:hypothetical protein